MPWEFSVLVVANVTAASDELLEALKERAAEGNTRFTLLVPAAEAGSVGRQAAREKLEQGLERMRAEGLEVEGVVGDPDPVGSVFEHWDPQEYDDIVIATLPTGASKWLQVDLPGRIERMTGVHVRHVVSEPRREVKASPPPEHPSYGVLAPLAPLMLSARRAASGAARAAS